MLLQYGGMSDLGACDNSTSKSDDRCIHHDHDFNSSAVDNHDDNYDVAHYFDTGDDNYYDIHQLHIGDIIHRLGRNFNQHNCNPVQSCVILVNKHDY